MNETTGTVGPQPTGNTGVSSSQEQIAQLESIFEQAAQDAVQITALRTEGNTKVDASRQRPNN